LQAFNQLPVGWTWARLGDISENVDTVNPIDTPDKEFLYLDITSIDDQQRVTNPKRILWKSAPSRARQLVRTGDILFSTVRTYLRKIAYVSELYDNQIASTGFCVIRPYSPINSKFIFLLTQTDRFVNALTELQRGTHYPAVRNSDVLAQVIPLPPIFEQNRIVSKITELFAQSKVAKESIDKIKPIMKKLRQSILFAAASGQLTANWRLDNPNVESASEFLDPIVRMSNNNPDARVNIEELPKIPQSWEWTSLQAISEIRGGITKGKKYNGKKTIQLPYLRVANVQDGYLNLSEIKTIQALPEDIERYRLKKGDILFNEGGDRDKLGRGCIWNEEIRDCIHQNHVFRARLLSDNILPDYVTIFSKSKLARSYFFKFASQTVNLASLNMTALKNLPIAIPPKSEQEEIFHLVNEYLSLADRIEQFCQKARDNRSLA
jgi:type I restriction enzyme, S subunit